MKRSSSLFDTNCLKQSKRILLLKDTTPHRKSILSSSHSPTAKKVIETVRSENIQILSPAPAKKSLQTAISKIYTSDFWTPTMKFQYKKLAEGKLTKNPSVAAVRSPVLCVPLLEERFRRGFYEDSAKTDLRSSVKLENLDKIINECREERSRNKLLGMDLYNKRKTIKEDFRRIKNSINLR